MLSYLRWQVVSFFHIQSSLHFVLTFLIFFGYLAIASASDTQVDGSYFTEAEVGQLSKRIKSNSENLEESERYRLLELAAQDDIGPKYCEGLLNVLTLSLDFSDDRIQEASRYADKIETILKKELTSKALASCFKCIVLSFNDEEHGTEKETEWFRRIKHESVERQEIFISCLAYANWTDPCERLLRLKELYQHKHTAESVRVHVITVVGELGSSFKISLTNCVAWYRELAMLPQTSPTLLSTIFDNLLELSSSYSVREEAIKLLTE